jgi:hypothetical protein
MFFKLTVVKCQLGLTIMQESQDRLKTLMLASAADILLHSDDDKLVASFASIETERRILLA